MSLTWKDGAATLLTGLAVVVAYAKVKSFDWPLLTSWRMASLLVVLIGLAGCILVGSGQAPTKNAWTTTATVLGALSFVLAVAGMILNNKTVFLILTADIVALWVITTLHHLLDKGV